MSKSKEHTFNLKHTSGATGEEYTGMFTCKKQAIMDHTKIARRKTELCGGTYCVKDDNGNPTGQGIDDEIETTNQVIATLETVLVQAPEWWDLTVLDDYGLLVAVFQEVQKFEGSFRKRPGTGATEGSVPSSEGSGATQHQTAKPADNAPKVVDKQVQASLDA